MSPDCCTLINVSFTAQVPLRFYFRCRSLHSTVLRSLLHYVCLAIPIYLHFLWGKLYSMLLHAKTMEKCLLQVYTAVKRLPISFTQGIKNLAKSYSNGKRIDFVVCVSLCEKSSPFFKWEIFSIFCWIFSSNLANVVNLPFGSPYNSLLFFSSQSLGKHCERCENSHLQTPSWDPQAR